MVMPRVRDAGVPVVRTLLGGGLALTLLLGLTAGLPDPSIAEAGSVPPAAGQLTSGQALTVARRTGKPVEVAGATTETDTLTANPNGTFTLRRAMRPVRAFDGSAWRALDATLKFNGDGTVSPAVSAGPLVLSGGGRGPLARMGERGRSAAFSVPMPLPKPTLAGRTATYPGVLPGVDLQVIADDLGGFSEVLVVRDATAAAHPALRSLTLAVAADGITVAADEHGNITGKDRLGHVAFNAPVPRMWDSAGAASTVYGPGAAARRSTVGVRVAGNGVTLAPDRAMLGGPGVTYPLFIDPAFVWTPHPGTRTGWATVSRGYAGNDYSNSNYWNNTPDPDNHLQVGNSNWTVNGIWSRSLVNFKIDTAMLTGATIYSATIDTTLVRSANCTPHWVDLYAPADTLAQPNATWNWWNGRSWGGVIDRKNAAAGYTGCTNAAPVAFDVRNTVLANIAAHKDVQTFLWVAENESDIYAYKEFLNNPTLTILYNHAPNPPAGLSTSPATSCAASPPSVVGDNSVTLYAPVSDPEGNQLGVNYRLWKTADPGTLLVDTDANLLTAASGQTAAYIVPQATLRTAAGSAVTQFSWRVQTTDGNLSSPWSATCSFSFDPTRTGAPGVQAPAAAAIGQASSVTVTAPPTGTVPAGYLYQLNGAAAATVAATAGNATIPVTPTRFTNVLTVTSLSAGGNIGDTATVIFNATPAAVAASDDLTGDGAPDLLGVGGAGALPAGLWLGKGSGGGSVDVVATNIGVYGNGVYGTNSPADFTGATAVSGHFTGSGLQDLLVYYPSGTNAGGGMILNGNGDGSPLQAHISGNEHTLSAGLFTDMNGRDPLRIVNAGDSSHLGLAYPDLLAVNGDATVGYYLAYYRNLNGLGNYPMATHLPNTTPDGDMAWNGWTIASTQLGSGTSLYLWKPATGALYLWKGLSFDVNTDTLTYTQYAIRTSGWNTNAAIGLQASDINADGTADLWTTTSAGAVTAHLVSGLTGTPTITAQAAQTLITGNHAWTLNDGTSGAVGAGSARDIVGTAHLTGTAGAAWNTGDLFSPDASLNGTTGALSGPKAIDTNADFTISVWVKPTAAGGAVLSQDGTTTTAFILWANPADRSWQFSMSTADSSSAAWDVAAAAPGSVQLGVWTRLTATYKQATGVVTLYINGVRAAGALHYTTWNAGGQFQIGRSRSGAGQYGSYLAGQVANVQTWNAQLYPDVATHIVNANSSLCLLARGSTSAPAVQYYCLNFADQLWSLEYAGTDTAGTPYYRIRNAASSLCLLARDTGVDAYKAVSYTCLAYADQHWYQVSVGSGRFQIKNRNSGLCLLIQGGAVETQGVTWACHPEFADQLWHS